MTKASQGAKRPAALILVGVAGRRCAGARPMGDIYPAGIAFQWIDITGLKSGRYRLRATADPANWFAETNNTNNSAWVDLRLTSIRGGLRVGRLTSRSTGQAS